MRRPSPSATEVRKLTAQIHAAALDTALWTGVLDGLCQLFQAATSNVGIRGTSPGAFCFEGVGLDASDAALFNSYYAAIDPWMLQLRAQKLLPHTSYRASHALLDDSGLYRSECYQDFLRPRGLHYGFGGTIGMANGNCSIITLTRSKSKGPIEDAEERAVLTLLPHFRQAVLTQTRLAILQAENETNFGDPLDSLGRAVFLLDADGRILRMNRSAHSLANAADGLTAHPDGLRAALTTETVSLRVRIRQSAAGVPAKPFLITRPSGRRAHWVAVCPLAREQSAIRFGFPVPAVAVIAVDPEYTPEPDPASLIRLFGLTDAEARLACLLSEGTSLEQSATSLAITRNTARTHLQHLFQKTSTRKQTELVALLIRTLLSR